MPDRRFENYFRDGLHLSQAGYDLLYTELMKVFDYVWQDQLPEKLPFAFPAWDDEEAWGKEDVRSQI